MISRDQMFVSNADVTTEATEITTDKNGDSEKSGEIMRIAQFFRLLRIIKLFRIIRIFKLARHIGALKALGKTCNVRGSTVFHVKF